MSLFSLSSVVKWYVKYKNMFNQFVFQRQRFYPRNASFLWFNTYGSLAGRIARKI